MSAVAIAMIGLGVAAPAAVGEWVSVGRDCAHTASGSLCAVRQVDPDRQRMRGRWEVSVAEGEWIRPRSAYVAVAPRNGQMLGPCGTTLAGTQIACGRLTTTQVGAWTEYHSQMRGVFGYVAETSRETSVRVAAGDTGWRAIARPTCEVVSAGRVCINMGERIIGRRLLRRVDAATRPRRGQWITPRTLTLLVRPNREGSVWSIARTSCASDRCGTASVRSKQWHDVLVRDATNEGQTVRIARFEFQTNSGSGSVEIVDR